LPEAALAPGSLGDPDAPAWDGLLARAIGGDGVRAVFQPVVDLARLTVVGYEALARFDAVAGVGPDRWFAAAARRGLVPELEAATLRAGLASWPDLPRSCFLAVNVEPESLLQRPVLDVLLGVGDLGGLVVEVTEHRPIDDPGALTAALDRLRGAGARIAVDDAGAGFAGLQQILHLRPSILKLDRALVEGVDRDEAKAALVEMLGLFANRIDAWLLAEGVETLGEAHRLAELGVPLVQGFLFARPGPPWAGLDPATHAVLAHRADQRASAPLLDLLEPTAWLLEHELPDVGRLFGQVDRDAVVVLDSHRRPVGVVSLASALSGTVLEALRVNASSTVADVAHRLSTRVPADTATPVVVTDDAGRYLGTIAVTRLLASLASALR
jgi:EAL domain-containing protein (putative c-di-GMP-specific phosphodiesterase class I)